MFSYTLIAENFGISKTKCSDLINYGFAVYIKEKLVKTVKYLACFVISYDKILNKILQEERMDLSVMFWDDKSGKMITNILIPSFYLDPVETYYMNNNTPFTVVYE